MKLHEVTRCSAMVSVVLAAAAFAVLGDVTYTGADADDPLDLSLASNWSAAPTASDLATINMSGASGTAFTLSGALTVKGLSFTSVTAAISLAGPGTLTLGEGGITFNAGKSFTLTAPVTTTAAQTWDFKTTAGTFTCGAKISGTADLVWKAFAIMISEPPDYGGKITASTANKWNSYIQITKKGRIAASVVFTGQFYQDFSGTWSPSDLVDNGFLNLSGWNHPFFNNQDNTVFNIGTGEKVYNTGDGAYFIKGTVNQTGGEMTLSCVTAIGREFNANRNPNAMEYNMSDGLFQSATTRTESVSLLLGVRNTSGKASIKFNQSGGTVKFKTAVYVGGMGGTSTSICEYNKIGGTLVPARPNAEENNHYESVAKKGLVFAANNLNVASGQTDYNQTSVGVFSQSGGETDALRVRWGDTGAKESYFGVACTNVLEGFGIFDLSGGLFMIDKDGFCVSTNTWNKDLTGAAVTNPNSAYRIRLRGGTLQPKAALVNKMQWEVEPSDDPNGFTLDTNGKNVDLLAPVWGAGKFRKTGAGVLTVADMSRFTGELAVDAGRVELLGSYSDEWSGGAIILSGDGAAAGLDDPTNNAPVASWTTDDGLRTAVEIPAATDYVQPALPKLAVDAFNGHAGVKFASSGLMFSKELNPIAQQTNWSVAVVFKDTAGGNLNDENTYNWCYGRTLLGNTVDGTWIDNEYALAYASTSGELSHALVFGVGYNLGGSNKAYVRQCAPKGNLNDGKVHVAICSMSDNRTTLNVDGMVTNVVTEAFAGNIPRRNACLYIGLGNNRKEKEGSLNYSAFAGTMAEIRFYTNRVLTVAEQNGLARALRAKYSGDNVVTMAHDFPAGAAGSLVSAEPAAPALPSGANVWCADDLSAADGAAVSTWTSDTGLAADSTTGGGLAAPTLVKNALNGHAVLRFSAADKTALGVAAASSPVAGRSAFAAAVVFRTTTDSADENVARGGQGLVSAVAGSSANAADFSLSLQKEGSMRALYGGTSDVFCWTRKPCRLADGTPHVAIISADPDGGQLRLMTDGLVCRKTLSAGAARTSNNLLFGSLSAALNKYFTGDIAEVVVWPRALSEEEMTAATEHFAAAYAFRPLAKYPFGLEDTPARGLGATNIVVASGAVLRVPQSAAAPLTLGAGQTVSGDGVVEGTIRFGAGAELDVSRPLPAIDDVRLSGCTLRFPAPQATPYSIPNLSEVSGAIVVDVSAWKGIREMPAKVRLLEIPPAVVAPGATFTQTGLKSSSRVVYDADSGELLLCTMRGIRITLK